MSLVMQLDNRTLLVGLCVSATLFAFAFARTWQAQRSLRGAGSFALAFLCAASSCFLFTVVSASSPLLLFLNTVVGDILVCCVFGFLLAGIEHFFGVHRSSRLGWGMVGVAAVSLFFYTELHDSMVARIVVLGLVGFGVRLLIGVELLRHSKRRHLRTLSSVMFLYALFSLFQAVETLLRGTPQDYMRSDFTQTGILFLDFLFILLTGLLLFLMLNDELVMRLENEAARDFLSGLLNRRGIERTLLGEMERSRRHGAPLSIGLVDLDHFKKINDTHGHAAGDGAILSVARTITSGLRAYDHVGRFGGDEFLLILPDTLPAQAAVVVDRIREELARSPNGPLTLSIGLTSMTAEDQSASLLARVDEALYEAKKDGRDCVRVRLHGDVSNIDEDGGGLNLAR
jgi:diguanylate cyclase (GGDEF)-like protein